MADRRMFTKKITEDDNFLQLSSSAQALYLHLMMSADDDGFSNQVSLSMFRAHASITDLEKLLEKRYIYQFENGVIVIKHFRMANALRKDRYTPTVFQEELRKLKLKDNGSYTWLPDGCQMVAERLPQYSIGKDSIDKNSIDEDSIGEDILSSSEEPKDDGGGKKQKHKYGEFNHVLLTNDEFNKLCDDFGQTETLDAIKYLDEYIEMKGAKYKSHYMAIRKWVIDAVREKRNKNKKTGDNIDWDNA